MLKVRIAESNVEFTRSRFLAIRRRENQCPDSNRAGSSRSSWLSVLFSQRRKDLIVSARGDPVCSYGPRTCTLVQKPD